ncbi:MAG: DUF4407 domain-containing protein [Firmicutes bacterium]|nr:DUF4407 domain-containing protein [Bacillota bacterium]
MEYTPDYINQIAEQQRQALQAQIDAQRAQQIAALQKQIQDAPVQYQGERNSAYINNALMERARKEKLATMGLSGMGGMSQTLEQRNYGNLLNQLGSANRQQQSLIDTLNLQKGDVNRQLDASLLSGFANIDAQKNQQLLEQANWQKQFEEQQKQVQFERAWNLLQRKLISEKQFEAMTGISVKKAKKKKATPLPDPGGLGQELSIYSMPYMASKAGMPTNIPSQYR